MKYIILFAAVMSLLTTHARARGADFSVTNNCAKFEVVNNCPKAQPVRPALNIDSDHYCDRLVLRNGKYEKCGTYANVVKQEANGMHSHQCSSCGNTWWHDDQPKKSTGAAPVQSFTLPSSNCPGGNCPTSRPAPTRWRLFK